MLDQGSSEGIQWQYALLGASFFNLVVRTYVSNDQRGQFEIEAIKQLAHWSSSLDKERVHRGEIEKIRHFVKGFLSARNKRTEG